MPKFHYVVKSGEEEILKGCTIAESLEEAQSRVLGHLGGRKTAGLSISINDSVTLNAQSFGKLFEKPYSYKLASQPRRPW